MKSQNNDAKSESIRENVMKSILKCTKFFCLTMMALVFFSGNLTCREDLQFKESYLKPAKDIQNYLTRNIHMDVLNSPGPRGNYFMIPVRANFSNLKLMSQKTYRLGMLEFCPEVNRDWRLSTYGIKGLKIFSLKNKKSWEIKLPQNIFISDMMWSPKGDKIAFLAHQSKGTQVWMANIKTGKVRMFNRKHIMTTLTGRRGWGSSATAPSKMLKWMPDGSLLTLMVPDSRGSEPEKGEIPASPLIRKTRKKATPTSTYPFLLRTLHDKKLFEYYTTSQLVILKKNKSIKKIGKPGMFSSISLSPDGKYILAERIEKPFSYITSYSSFPKVLEILDLNGKVISTIRKNPLKEGNNRDNGNSVRDKLPREVSWRPGGGLALLLKDPAPEEKKSDKEKESKKTCEITRYDRLLLLKAPFDLTKGKTLVSTRGKLSSFVFSKNGKLVFINRSEKRLGKKSGKDFLAYDISGKKISEFILKKDIKSDDPTKQMGNIIRHQTLNGIFYALVTSDGGHVFFQGAGYNKEFKPRPFIDKINIKTAKVNRIFEGAKNYYDRILKVLDTDAKTIMIQRESKSEYPDSYLKDEYGKLIKLTGNKNPYPEFEHCKRENFEYTRRDGLKISGKISLPVGYQKGTRVPAIFWTYPSEFKSKKEYEKRNIRRKNLNTFSRFSNRNASDIWLSMGYAVVVPDIPIVGKGQTANNNFIAHLIDSMYAAIRHLDNLGYIDSDRLLHGGHSYGAFATANILARTPFFKAGIAGDGAYNRTLTPMTFQREPRFIWEAQDIYLEMSPFFEADHLDTPILMYHGEVDNNTGTFLIQSERFIQALTGLGKTASLYIYPFESHGPRCIETVFDLWARWIGWADKYVKNAGCEKKEKK